MRELSSNGVSLKKNGNQIVLEGPASVLTDALVDKLRELKSDLLHTLADWDSGDWQAFYDERAGICEFDGTAARFEAERRAYECCITEWLYRHLEATASGQCAHCRQDDQPDHVVVPFGTENHTWLHPECWPSWHELRRTQAIAALTAMGITRPAYPTVIPPQGDGFAESQVMESS
jgi:hypothetical protein